MRSLSTVLALLVTICFSWTAFAATVLPESGKVSINQGDGYKPVHAASHAKPGDVVMVSPDGGARVVYNEQCSVGVKPGYVVTIASEPPCKKTVSFDRYGTRMNAGITPGKGFAEPPTRHHWGWVPSAAIAVVVGLCIGDVICDDDPASP